MMNDVLQIIIEKIYTKYYFSFTHNFNRSQQSQCVYEISRFIYTCLPKSIEAEHQTSKFQQFHFFVMIVLSKFAIPTYYFFFKDMPSICWSITLHRPCNTIGLMFCFYSGHNKGCNFFGHDHLLNLWAQSFTSRQISIKTDIKILHV